MISLKHVLSCSVMSNSLQPHGLQPVRLLCPWNSPGKNTGVACHSLLQGIFPILGSNPGLPHCRQVLYCLSHQVSPSLKHGMSLLRRGPSPPGQLLGPVAYLLNCSLPGTYLLFSSSLHSNKTCSLQVNYINLSRGWGQQGFQHKDFIIQVSLPTVPNINTF